ncbi:MAG: DNA-binding response regulator, partial [Mucilaginibacter sp.]|nr:DNA-binding response regulator [Mucilaginibacter sp.]
MSKNKQIILYGTALAALLFLLKWLETRYILLDQQLDIYLGIVAVLFT